jgi:hypothetical protein
MDLTWNTRPNVSHIYDKVTDTQTKQQTFAFILYCTAVPYSKIINTGYVGVGMSDDWVTGNLISWLLYHLQRLQISDGRMVTNDELERI